MACVPSHSIRPKGVWCRRQTQEADGMARMPGAHFGNNEIQQAAIPLLWDSGLLLIKLSYEELCYVNEALFVIAYAHTNP